MYVSSREEHCQGKKYAISIYKKIAQDKPELKQIGNIKKSIKCNTLNIVVSGKFDTCRYTVYSQLCFPS